MVDVVKIIFVYTSHSCTEKAVKETSSAEAWHYRLNFFDSVVPVEQ